MIKLPSLDKMQEKLSSFSIAEKVALFMATILILGGGYYYLKYDDQVNSIARLQRDVGEQEKKLATLKEAARKVDQLEKELVKSEEELAELMTLLPDQKEIPGLLENVSRLGTKVGLENILFQPQPEVPQELHAVIPIRLDLVGSFNDFGVFLDSISKLNRILKVETVTLARAKSKSGVESGSLLQVGCTMVTYRFLDKPVVKKPGSPLKK